MERHDGDVTRDTGERRHGDVTRDSGAGCDGGDRCEAEERRGSESGDGASRVREDCDGDTLDGVDVPGGTGGTGGAASGGPDGRRPEVDAEAEHAVAAEGSVACDRCGAPGDADRATWTLSVEGGERSWICGTCSRANLRAIEGRLDSAWW